jgi:hypothetical protein
VAAVGLKQVVYERKGVFDDLIPLWCADLSPLESNSRTNVMQAEEEDLDARIEIMLCNQDDLIALLFTFIFYILKCSGSFNWFLLIQQL